MVRVHICKKKSQILLLILLSSLLVAGLAKMSYAETYSLTETPSRTQESNSPTVLLVISVAGATIGDNYQFTFQVTDPAGNTHQASNQTVGGAPSSFVLSVNYPSAFGTNVDFVGTYTINVQENRPANIASVQTGEFQVGLTDKISYQRTFPVSIKARAYPGNSLVGIDISHDGASAPGYPAIARTDSAGSVSNTWTIPANISTGLWTVSVIGGGPAKTVPDVQTFSVYPTNVSISQFEAARKALERTGIQLFTFTASYLSGLPVHTGSAQVRVTTSDGTTSFNIAANYNVTLDTFSATYKVLPNDEDGIWIGTIDPYSFDDGYGNRGPISSTFADFTVIPATLSVVISISNQIYGPDLGIPIYALVTNPDGSVFSNGSVTADFSYNFAEIGNPLALTFIPGQAKWAGVYRIGSSDPSGLWLVKVRASDSYGNVGEQISSAVVNVPPSSQTLWPGGLTTSSFLMLVGILAATAMAVFALVFRRKAKRAEFRLDISMVDKEVDKIQSNEFFQNIKRQVEGGEPPSKSPHDESKDPS